MGTTTLPGSAEEPPVVSEKDLALIEALQIAPRIPAIALSEILDDPPTSLSRRLQRLGGDRVLRIVGRFAVPLISRESPLRLSITCEPAAVRKVATRLLAIPDIQFLAITTGRRDIFATVFPLLGTDVGELLESTIPGIPGIASVETSMVLELNDSGLGWRLHRLGGDQVAALAEHRVEVTEATPASIEEFSPLELKALDVLGQDARTSAAEMARQIGVSSSTAYRTINTLLSSGAVWPRLEIEPAVIGYPIDALLDVQTRPGRIRPVIETLSKHPATRDVALVSGRTPISFYGVFEDARSLAGFVADELGADGDVTAAETTIGLDVLRRYWIDRDGVRLGAAVEGLLRPGR